MEYERDQLSIRPLNELLSIFYCFLLIFFIFFIFFYCFYRHHQIYNNSLHKKIDETKGLSFCEPGGVGWFLLGGPEGGLDSSHLGSSSDPLGWGKDRVTIEHSGAEKRKGTTMVSQCLSAYREFSYRLVSETLLRIRYLTQSNKLRHL